jgi:hypothetical protein
LNTAGLDTDRLIDAWNYVESLGQRQSLIVIRHGWIAGEWDHVGTGPVNSATKSLTGLALAKLFELSDAGRLPKKIGYDDLACHFLHTWHGWWVNWSPDWPSSQRAVWPFVPQDAFWMSGYGKDICVVIPSLDMVIAHQTARAGGLKQMLSDCPEFFSTLLAKVMAAVVTPLGKPSTQTTATVEHWDTYEHSLSAAGSYGNPFQDVSLTAMFTHAASGARFTMDGFYDGGRVWRFRFMPLHLGTWHWTTASTDRGLNGKTGTLECVTPTKSYLHGPLMTDRFHFQHADGTPRFLISTRLTCQFAPPAVWPPLIGFLKANHINRVLFMMPGVDSKKDPVYTQRNLFAPGPDYTRYHVEAFRAIDEFIDTLRQADILASPYFYYDPRREVMWKMTPQQDRDYVRYGMARLGAFSNVMPVLANEVELKTTNYKDPAFDLSCHAWVNEMGSFLKSRAVFGQPISVHNPCWHNFAVHPSYFTLLTDWPFAAWTDFLLKQAQVGCIGAAGAMSDAVPQPQAVTYNERSYARHNQVLIGLRKFGQPVINEEPAYDMGSKSAYASQTSETMRPTFWTATTAGAYTVWGSLSVYETGDPLPKMKGSATPKYLRVLHDVMADLPYGKMEPHNESVTPAHVILDGETWRTNFALAQPGAVYLVYSLHGGTGVVTLAPGQYSAVRIDPRDGTRMELGVMAGGTVDFSLPRGDWVLIYRSTPGSDPMVLTPR